MDEIIKRPIDWNTLRYKQEYHHELASDLLFEEFQEWDEAETDVDKLDALVDLYFVAIGVLWKLGLEVEDYLADQETSLVTSGQKAIEQYLSRFMESTDSRIQSANVAQLVFTSLATMETMGLNEAQIRQAILVVCDSNDSKPAKKTKSYVKANIDKGDAFISPEPRLQLILDEVHNAT